MQAKSAFVPKFSCSVQSVPFVHDLKGNCLSVFVPLYSLFMVLFLPLTLDSEKGVMSKADRKTAPAIGNSFF